MSSKGDGASLILSVFHTDGTFEECLPVVS